MKLKLGKFVFILLVSLLATQKIWASGSFSLKPAKQELELSAGQTQIIYLTVTNHLGRSAVFQVQAENLSWSTSSTLTLSSAPSYSSILNFTNIVKPSDSALTLSDGATGRLPVTVSVPAEVLPGGFYGAVVVTSSSLGSGATAKLSSSLGSLWFISVKGNVKKAGELTSFKLFPSVFFTRAGGQIFISYKNTGNIYLNPYGLIEVKNLWGKKITAFKINPWFVLPGSERLLELPFHSNSWQFGPYRATLLLNRGYGNVVDSRALTFWYLPWWSLLFILLLAALFFWAVLILVKRLKK